MKLEAGKFYLAGDGSKFGPLLEFGNGRWFYCYGVAEVWNDDGKNRYSGIDLVAEWNDEPVTTEQTTRARILDTARRCVTQDRNATHGKPEDTFGLIAAYWSAHLDTEVTATDVAAMMALLKIARIKMNPKHIDSYVDLCGYGACAGELASKDDG